MLRVSPAPPKAAVVRTYRSAERYGLVWIARGEPANEPDVPDLPGTPVVTLRSVTVHASQRDVNAALAAEPPAPGVTLVLQPESDAVTTVHGIATHAPGGPERIAFLREQNERLKALRRSLEPLTA